MNLTPEQYETMCREFPGVNAYIIHCELRNEIARFERNEYILTDCEKTRLNFLREYRAKYNPF